jgi:hypothetical protein
MKTTAIVLSQEKSNYRKVAQESWGLSDEQMQGMHVHHHPERCNGGRNIPEHLYVCSPEMHSYGWHDGDWFTVKAVEGQRKGLETRRKNIRPQPDKRKMTPEERKQLNTEINKRRIGRKYRDKSREKMSQAHKNSKKSQEHLAANNSKEWMDPDHPELGVRTICGLANMQRKRGYPTGAEHRVKVTR